MKFTEEQKNLLRRIRSLMSRNQAIKELGIDLTFLNQMLENEKINKDNNDYST